MRTPKAPARCYALVQVQSTEDETERQAMRKARRLWPEGELRIDRIYSTAPRFVMYEIVRKDGA